ncbi:Pro-Pol polyprotein [Araneus ventricosus]|uniref:Pro-Pol polyprotein n=1 Tax=Araneus ventricosus TaxID=182803 RepID=A0A4Y2TP63_ARAVE|nr:Pro-Pol polyprotein [Araneus ventricosus]
MSRISSAAAEIREMTSSTESTGSLTPVSPFDPSRGSPGMTASKQQGKQEGELHPIPKVELSLDTYDVDHLGPLENTNKNYKHIICVMDSFTKFAWLYPTKSTFSQEVISKLELQKSVFGNPRRIISDKSSTCNSKEFDDFCSPESIQHLSVATGLPRANGQVERLNSTIIAVIFKLSKVDPTKWFKFVPELQRILNSTYQRSINLTPFEVLVGVKMRDKSDLKIRELIEKEIRSYFQESRENLRKGAKQQILKVQESNRKTYYLRRKPLNKYKINDIVAIKRTQHGPGLKFKFKFLGPYKITKIKPNDTYDVKIGFIEGPVHTSTCAEYLKPW